MATPIELIKKAGSAAAVFAGEVKVSAFIHRLVTIAAAASAAGATFVDDNEVLLGASPEQVVYASAVAAFIATCARIFAPKA